MSGRTPFLLPFKNNSLRPLCFQLLIMVNCNLRRYKWSSPIMAQTYIAGTSSCETCSKQASLMFQNNNLPHLKAPLLE